MVLIDLIKLSPLNSSQSISFLAPFELPRQKMPQQLSSGSAVPSPFSSRLATKVTRVRSVISGFALEAAHRRLGMALALVLQFTTDDSVGIWESRGMQQDQLQSVCMRVRAVV